MVAKGVGGSQRLEVVSDGTGDKEVDGHLALLRLLLQLGMQLRRKTDGRRNPRS